MNGRMTADLVAIVSAGGGLDIDASMRMTPDLQAIAAAAARSGATVIFRGMASRMTNELQATAAAGKGRVIFAD
jgi:hypothetical protein